MSNLNMVVDEGLIGTPTPRIQALLDAALRLGGTEQQSALENVLESALSDKDYEGIRASTVSLQNWFTSNTDLHRSKSYFEALLERAKTTGVEFFVAIVAFNLAVIVRELGDTNRALDLYASARVAFRRHGYLEGIIQSLQMTGIIHYDLGNLNDALETYNHVIWIAKTFSLRETQAYSLSRIAIIHGMKGNFKESLAGHRESLSLYDEVGDIQGSALCHNNIGIVLVCLGDTTAGYSEHELALSLRRQIDDKRGIAQSLDSLAKIWIARGNLDLALGMQLEALEIARGDISKRFLADSLSSLAETYRMLGKYDKSLAYNHEALSIYRVDRFEAGIATSLNNIAYVNYLQGNIATALDQYSESLAINRKLGFKLAVAVCQNNIALIYQNRGDFDSALSQYQNSLTLYEELGDRNGIALSLNNIGAVHFLHGQVKLAQDYLNRSLNLYRQTGNTLGLAQTANNVGGMFRRMGELDRALALHSESLLLFSELKNPNGIAASHTYLALVYDERGDLARALDHQQQAEKIYRDLNEQSGLAQSLSNIAGFQMQLGSVDKALLGFTEALMIRKTLGDLSGQADLTRKIANIHHDVGDMEKALSMLADSLELFTALREQDGIASALSDIANIYSDLGNLDNALSSHKESLEIDRATGNAAGIATTLGNMALVLYNRGEFEKAQNTLTESLDAHRRIGSKRGEANVLTNLAHIHIDRANYIAAAGLLKDSYQLCFGGGYKEEMARHHIAAARYFSAMGRFQKASEACSLARQIYRDLGFPKGESEVYISEGDALRSVGKFNQALLAYRQSLNILRKSLMPTAGVSYRIGTTLFRMGDYKSAVPMLVPAISFARKHGSGDVFALTSLGRLYLATGELENSMESLKFALVSAELMRNPAGRAGVYSALADHALTMKDTNVAVMHLQRAIESYQQQRRGGLVFGNDDSSAERSLITADYNKLITLLAKAGRLDGATDVLHLLQLSTASPGTMDSERIVTEPVRSKSAAEIDYLRASERLAKLGDRERLLSSVRFPTQNIKREKDGISAGIKAASASLQSALHRLIDEQKVTSSVSNRTRDISGVQVRITSEITKLGGKTAAVTLLCLPESIFFTILTGTTKATFKVDVSKRELTAKVKAFFDILSNPNTNPVPIARELYELLWKPVEPELRKLGIKRVLLSLTGSLQSVPFGALHDGTGFLAERWELGLFSPTALNRLSVTPNPQKRVLTAGCGLQRTINDGFGTKIRFDKLPGVHRELDKVMSTFGAKPTVLEDQQFTLASLKQALETKPTVVHFASHFRYDSRSESLCYLVTGKGDVLRVSDTSVLTKDVMASVDLLTLSACQTARFSETADGLEVDGLATLMQRKGAAAVLATLWSVADSSTAEFMTMFYGLYCANPQKSKLWCLCETQRWMIHGRGNHSSSRESARTKQPALAKHIHKPTEKRWSHPYYWAPFVLYGNPL
jgi:CHAT domain-containing protein/Tfp pilus assembly protein PilF